MDAAPAVDCVVHAGFEVTFRPDAAAEARNRESTGALLRYFRAGRARRLLFLSGAGVLGVGSAPVARDESCFAETGVGFEAYRETAYIRGKIEAERSLRAAGIPLTVLYLSTVYGPGMPAGTLATAKHGKLAPPGGTSFLALADFLEAADLALAAPAEGESYVVNGGNLPFAELYAAARGGGGYLVLPRCARWLFRAGRFLGGGAPLSFAVMESAFGYKYYSAEKFARRFGWRPRWAAREVFARLPEGERNGA
jgi:nucleoside-diphosphate-sugar epimerase